jgi:antitoxin (DNA-binding transcriptional repressor) of toxin-antitoxin stability system
VINSRDLEENMDRLLQRVEDGESMDVTRHGRVVARLIPPDRQTISTDEEQARIWAALSEKARRADE